VTTNEELESTTETTSESSQPKKEKLTPAKMRANIEAGERWLKSGHYKGTDTRWAQWEKNKKYLMCVWDSDGDTDVNVNTIFSNYNTVRPSLYFKNPTITATPTQPEFKKTVLPDGTQVIEKNDLGHPILVDNYNAAKLLGIKINYELREINFKKTMKKVLGDCLCPYGVGWVKWGYSTNSVGGHSNQRDRSYSYWAKRVDPRDLVYDWMATDIEDATFTAERIVMTRKQAEKQGFKIPKGHISVLPDHLKYRAEQAREGKDESDLVVIWEYHDLEEDTLHWLLDFEKEGSAEPKEIRESVHEPYPFEGSEYVPLVLNENNDDIIGLSDVEPVEDQALAINRIRTKQTRHIEKFGTTTYYEDGAIEVKDLENMVETDHGAYVKVQQGRMGGIQVEGTPAMGQDNYNMDTVNKEDMRTTLGITDYQQGGAKSRTATEGNIIQNAANIRIEERKDIIYDFVIEGIRRLVAMIQTFGEEEDFINIADVDLEEDFVDVLKEKYGFNPKIPFLKMLKKDIQGEFNFTFQVDDMVSRPKEVQLQQWINLLGMIGQNPVMIAAAEEEEISFGKVLRKVMDLAGADINEVKRSGPAQIPAEVENLMFEQGMEVPEPHNKDDHDDHHLSHIKTIQILEMKLQQVMQEMQGAQQEIMGQVQQVMTGAQPQTPEEAQALQVQAQQMQEQAQLQIQQIQIQYQQPLERLQMALRNAKLHVQAHDQKQMKKMQSKLGGGMGQQPQGQPAPNQQVQMQQQARQVG
jgi:hypothetical protein